MRLHRPSTRTSGPRRIVVRLLLAALAGALTLVATPGPAFATTTSTVTPIFDCYVDGNGTTTAVLGYTNTSRSSVTYSPGSATNTFYPTKYNSALPSTFKSGTYHGAFSVVVSDADAPYFTWTLGTTKLTYSSVYASASACAAGTTMPATGNGTGAAIVLVAAGLVGVLLVRRIVRRAATPAQVA